MSGIKDEKRPGSVDTSNEDDKELLALGYKPSFKREFSNLATISFAFSIMGLCSSIATTFNTPMLTGGPSSVVWCWILGACMCFTLGASIAEIVSAYPTCGGLYTASAQLTPKRHRAKVGWLVGWLNILGSQPNRWISSTEFGLANMILAAVNIATHGRFEITSGKTVGVFVGLLVFHGSWLNSLATRWLARLTTGFVFVNLGATFLIIIVLLATTPRSEMHSASYVFGSEGIINQTGLDGNQGWNTGIAFLFGLLSVQWTDYDATAHISEEVRRAAYAVIGTGLIGWLLNIVVVICSGPHADLVGSNSAFLQIMYLRMGKTGSLILWAFVCLTAFFVVQTALQAASRTIYAFSRDHGLPDNGFFGKNSKSTQTPLRAIWLTTLVMAAQAIFSLTAMGLDLSYVIPIFCRRMFHSHPDVMFKPGPFYMGDGIIGRICNTICIAWTLFVCVIFSLPTVLPVSADNMNYASVITCGVIILAFLWYILGAHKHYVGPQSNLHDESVEQIDQSSFQTDEKQNAA
ncbi:amino acid permease [Cyathus striatus]|nr:amino acid permease [Cyathus striatus]